METEKPPTYFNKNCLSLIIQAYSSYWVWFAVIWAEILWLWLTQQVKSAPLSWIEQWTSSTVQALQGSLQVYVWPKWHAIGAKHHTEYINIMQLHKIITHTCLRGPKMSCDWLEIGNCSELTSGHHTRQYRCLWCLMLEVLSPQQNNLHSSVAQKTLCLFWVEDILLCRDFI